jgi:hypothetical protein
LNNDDHAPILERAAGKALQTNPVC